MPATTRALNLALPAGRGPLPWSAVASRRSLALLAVLAVAVAVSVLLVVDAHYHPRAPYDLWLLQYVQAVDTPVLHTVFGVVDALTSSTGAIITWTGVLVLLLSLRWWAAAAALTLMPVGGVMDNLVGMLTVHDRPTTAEALRVASGTDATSFPSGHVLGAVLLYGFLFVLSDRVPRNPLRWTGKLLCVLVIATVGAGRVWYGAHWPSDVAGGYAIGLALLSALLLCFRWLEGANVEPILSLFRMTAKPVDQRQSGHPQPAWPRQVVRAAVGTHQNRRPCSGFNAQAHRGSNRRNRWRLMP